MKKILLIASVLSFYVSSIFATIQVVQVGSGGLNFAPNSFTITLGDTVKWVWSSGSHTTTATSIPVGGATWDQVIASANDSLVYIPTAAGPYTYKCTPHSGSMTGSFTVNPGTPPTPANAILVGMGGNLFSPDSINVVVGDTVKFLWVSGTHNTTSQTIPSGAAPWSKSMTSANDSLDYIVTVAGEYNYSCTLHAGMIGKFIATGGPTGIKNLSKSGSFILYPNPVNDSFTISYSLQRDTQVELSVFDITGKRMQVGFTSKKSGGAYTERIVTQGKLSKGLYLIQLRTDYSSTVQKLIVE